MSVASRVHEGRVGIGQPVAGQGLFDESACM